MSIRWDRGSSRDLELAASCWKCCTSGLNTARNVASSCSRSSGNMSSVRSGYSADWEAGVWPGSASMGAARSVTTTWLARTGTTMGTR